MGRHQLAVTRRNQRFRLRAGFTMGTAGLACRKNMEHRPETTTLRRASIIVFDVEGTLVDTASFYAAVTCAL
jgi:hypothetical protein